MARVSALDEYKTQMLDSDWYPPSPRRLRDFRGEVVDKLGTPLSRAVVASAARFLTTDPVTDPRAAALHAEAWLAQLQGDLRHATLYHVDERVCAMIAGAGGATEPVVLRPDMVPARHGLAVCAWPVAFTRTTQPRFDLVAVSWSPSRDQTLRDGGVDVTFWAAPTRHVRRHFTSVAAEAETGDVLLTRRGWRQQVGPLVLLNQVACGYGTHQRNRPPDDLGGFLRAAQALFDAASTVGRVRAEPVAARRGGWWRAGPAPADTEAYRLRWVSRGGAADHDPHPAQP